STGRCVPFPGTHSRRSDMKNLLLTAAALVILAVPAQGANEVTQLTLRIDGVHSDEDGTAIMNAIRKIPSVKVAIRPTTRNPIAMVVPLRGANYDVGDLARAVAKAQTPNRAKGAPSAALVLSYKSRKGRTVTENSLARTLAATCAKLKGVDAKKCKLDTGRKEVHVKLDDKGGAKLSEIKAAFPGLDVE